VAFLDGDKLHEARRGFRVTRPLKIEIETPKTPPQPGAETEIVLTARSSNGQPAANAELSLALASTALFAQFGDGAESIEEHFHGNLRRATSLRVNSNAGFHHRAVSKVVKLDESGASLAEAAETPSHRELEEQMQERERNVWLNSQADGLQRQRVPVTPSQFDPPQIAQGQGTLTLNGGGVFTLNATSVTAGLRAGQSPIQGGALLLEPLSANGRKSFAHDAQWHCPLVTDANGRASVKLFAPAVAGEWRMKAIGSTLSTHVGESVGKFVTKDTVSISFHAPKLARVGDVIKPTLKVFGEGKEAEFEFSSTSTSNWSGTFPYHLNKESKVTLNGTWMTPFELPAINITDHMYALRFNLGTSAGSSIHIEPFNQETDVRSSGEQHEVGTGFFLKGPGKFTLKQPSKNEFLLVRAYSGIDELVRAMLFPNNKLLSRQTTVSTIHRFIPLLKRYPENPPEVTSRYIQRLVSDLQITQRDGGWTWQDVDWLPDSIVTSLGLWGLIEARDLGLSVEEDAVKKASACLKRMLAVIPPEEPDKSAVILHALACVNEADFSVANRLYRDRDKLNDPALAWLAAAFQRMNRSEEAKTLIKALDAKNEWKGSTTTARLSSDADTCAAVLYAADLVEPGLSLSKRATEKLFGYCGFEMDFQSSLQGLWVQALMMRYAKSEPLRDPPDFFIVMKENGRICGNQTLIHDPKSDGTGQVSLEVDYKDAKEPPFVIASVISEAAIDEKAVAQADLPTVARREWLHEGLRHKDVPLRAPSASPVKVAAMGQRIRVEALLAKPLKEQRGYVIVDEPLPGGAMLVPGSVDGGADRVEVLPGLLRLWFIPGSFDKNVVYGYELMAMHAGTFAIPHTRVRDACRPQRFNAGPAGTLTILEPGKASTDAYVMNRWERLELAELFFKEEAHEEARKHLELLRGDAVMMKDHEREIAQMLLRIHTARQPMEARAVVELFEALSERHADVVIPFDQILQVAAAYRQIGEHERAWLVYRATMESGFVRDAGVSSALEASGDFIGGAKHLTELWMEHPDGEDGLLAVFSLGQRFQELAGHPASVPLRPGAVKWSEKQLLERSRDLLREFCTLHARDALADDAAFSLANVFFALKDYAAVVETAGSAARLHAKSPFVNQLHYMTALGRFWQYQFPEALGAAAPVAAGTSEDAPNARYITAQIHHAQGNAAEALRWYEKVRDDFEDADESIRVLEEKGVKLPHATRVKPGEAVKVELEHRNVQEAALTIYRVDLMKLHERQKDLAQAGAVNLSGITPQAELKVPLGDGKDYAWKNRALELPLKDEGAYLIICRGDSQITSGLVLVTTLELETHEDAQNGGLRVQVRDTARGSYLADAEMAVYDSAGSAAPQKGRSDPRGAFSASGIHGHATLVVKHGESRYAIHRSAAPLMAVELAKNETLTTGSTLRAATPAPAKPDSKPMSKDDYLKNVQDKFLNLNGSNSAEWQAKLEKGGKGVKAEKAFKK